MSSTHPVKESARAGLAQALHVDGTTRPQVLEREENPRYHALLDAWRGTSGAPALLNTSFNESGYPLVSSPVDALLMFLRTDIDTLVLNNCVVRKRV
jgi:predicted NodU family carbamoyl transferase